MPDLLSQWTSDSPTAPRLTWYGQHAERIELSGRVLATWVVKVTHLLTDLAGAGPGTTVRIDLEPHWRSMYWALGSWTAGACADLTDATAETAGPAPDVLVTSHPTGPAADAADLVLAQDLGDLAMRWGGDPLPPGVIDANAEVLGYPDHLGRAPIPHDTDPALLVDSGRVAHCGLLPWAASHRAAHLRSLAGVTPAPGARVLVGGRSLPTLLSFALAVWNEDGSMVVVPRSMNDATRDRIAEQERVDQLW